MWGGRVEQLITYLHENSDVEVVFPYDEIVKAMQEFSEYDFYYYRDTHWNNLGAYVGARALLEQLNISIPPLAETKIEPNSYGGSDLARMLHMSNIFDEELGYTVHFMPQVNYTVINEDFYTEFRYTSESKNNEKIMVIRDSFTSAMVPYIATSFKETVMPYADAYSKDMIAEEKPDIVVYETVERWLGNIRSFEIY